MSIGLAKVDRWYQQKFLNVFYEIIVDPQNVKNITKYIGVGKRAQLYDAVHSQTAQAIKQNVFIVVGQNTQSFIRSPPITQIEPHRHISKQRTHYNHAYTDYSNFFFNVVVYGCAPAAKTIQIYKLRVSLDIDQCWQW